MLRIHFSNHLEPLAEHLVKRFGETSSQDPFEPVTIVIQNRDTARWLSLRMSEKLGIAANIRFQLPAEWLWDQIRLLYPDLPELLPSDPEPMKWSIYQILCGQFPVRYPALKNYLDHDEQTLSASARWQLAGQITSVFDQYLVYRPGLLLEWEKGEVDPNVETWQPMLWNLLVDRWKSLEDKHLTKHRAQLWRELIDHLGQEGYDRNSTTWFFNPGVLPQPILSVIDAMRNSTDIRLYSIVPSGLTQANSIPRSTLLESLGTESNGFLNLLHNYFQDVEPEWITSEIDQEEVESSLIAVRKTITNNSQFNAETDIDESIQVRSCHNPLREVETLHQFLLETFNESSEENPIQPDDVLVVTPDLQKYAPFIDAVFGTREEGLPEIQYHLSRSSGSDDGGIGKAFNHLLEMPGSRFTRDDIMEFVRHSAIREKFGFNDSDVRTLNRWFEENRVIWGINGEHRKEFQQPKEQLQTWKSAINRGWLGQMYGGEAGEIFEQSLLYHGITSGDEKMLWAEFQQLLNLLIIQKSEAGYDRTVGEWCNVIRKWAERFFPSDSISHRQLQHLFNSIQLIEQEADTVGFLDKVPYDIIKMKFISLFENYRTGSARFTNGVVFSSMVPARSIPFRVVALLGLNDDLFPRRPVHPEFDLMSRDPKPGERNRIHEDRNLFLESILAAGEIHYTSYIGRNQKDGDHVPPSPILDEWIELLSGGDDSRRNQLVRQERLNGFSSEYFENGTGFSGIYLKTARTVSSKDLPAGLNVNKPLPDPEEEIKTLSVSELERFFKNPIEGFIRNRLGAVLREPEKEGEDEFESDTLDRQILFQHYFGWKIQGRSEDEILKLVRQSGQLPAGWPGRNISLELNQASAMAVEEIQSRMERIERESIHIDILLDRIQLTGTVYSYSTKLFLDVQPSKVSGKHLLSSWIRYLAVCAASEGDAPEALLLFGIRDGDPNWKRFKSVNEPRKILDLFVENYHQGLREPLYFFPQAGFKYVDNLLENNEGKAVSKAENEWSKRNWNTREVYGLMADPYVQLLYGEESELDVEKLAETSELLLTPMIEALEDLS